jgi:hypothetical protein
VSPPDPRHGPPAEARLARRCASSEEAQALLRALEPDQEGFVQARVEGDLLVLEVRSSSVPELRRTLEDTLACLSAAERTWNAAHGAGRAPTEGAVREEGSAEEDGETDEDRSA